jgi:hypothetical protein
VKEDEQIILYGPKYTGKWTDAQAGQSDYQGISNDGITRYQQLRAAAKAGRTPQGLAIETLVLSKLRADKGIRGATHEEERARRRNVRAPRPVIQAAPMSKEEVEAEIDE